jgi:hypothetical protein
MSAPESALTDSPDFESILSLASLAPDLAETPKADDVTPPAEEPVSPAIDEEALGEDLAESLDLEMELDPDFGAIVRSAVDKIGGEILFEVENVPESGHVAAVCMGDGDARRFVLVIQPSDGSPLRVEPTEESGNPLAALAQSYAGLVDAYKKAA